MTKIIEKFPVEELYRKRIFAFATDLDYPHIDAPNVVTSREIFAVLGDSEAEAIRTIKDHFGLSESDTDSLLDLSIMDSVRGCEVTGIYFGEINTDKLYALDMYAKTTFVNFVI